MPRLIWVFAGCTNQFVGFVMLQLISTCRNWNIPLWKDLFHTLLNVPSCDELPDLSVIRRQFEQYFVSELLGKYNVMSASFMKHLKSWFQWMLFQNLFWLLTSASSHKFKIELKLCRLMTKPTEWLCTQWRLRSAWASDQSLLCTQWVAKDLNFLHADSEDWSDWADAQADLSLRWAHKPFCWFCHEAAQLFTYGKLSLMNA